MVGLRLMREVHAVLDSKPLKSKAEIVLIILITITCTVSAVLYAYTICWIGNESKCELHTSSPPCSRTENNVRLSQCNFTLEVPKIGKLLLQLVSQPSKENGVSLDGFVHRHCLLTPPTVQFVSVCVT